MKRIILPVILCLLAGAGNADFELKDPASPEEAEAIEQQMKPVFKSSKEYAGDTIRLAKSDYLKLIIGNHVHGFKRFDSLVNASDDAVFVSIFYGEDEGKKAGAEKFADYLRKQLPVILGNPQYRWAKDVDITVSVYGEERY